MSPPTTVNIMAPPLHTSKKKFLDLNNPTLVLLFWDFFFGLPFSYAITALNKHIIQYLGYEKIMRCPSGVLGSRMLFTVVNVILVLNWAMQLAEEARMERARRELAYWDRQIEILEEVKQKRERRELEEQFRSEQGGKDRDRDGTESVVWADGKDWVPRKVNSPKPKILNKVHVKRKAL